MDDLDRFYALETRRRSLISTRSEPFGAGIAFFDDDYPDRFISNLLVVPEAQSFRSDQLIASADAILGGAGLPHRLVTVLDDRGGRGFETLSAHREKNLSPLWPAQMQAS